MGITESELADQLAESQNIEATPEVETEETPAVAETVEAQEPDPVQEYLNKYGGDTDAALKAAVEAQSLIGRQGQELGEIRKELQEFRQELTPQQDDTPQYEPVTNELVEWAQQIGYSDNAKEGAEWALNNQPAVYDEIMSAWYESDPKSAHRFEIGLATQAQQWQIMNQLQPTVAPLIAQSNRDQFVRAWSELKPTFSDIDNYAGSMLEAAQENPEMLAVLQNGDPESQKRVIANLYWNAKGRASAPLQTVTQAASQAALSEAQQLRTNAVVGTTTASAPPPVVSDEAPAVASWRAMLNEELGLAPEPE